mmetsp:Transcript_32878/g.60168  ORF Transcript_32878/g.60168 Transcript_32878/m.60168 type:complete len:450 (+) Transcript_32878:91-1440(+)
MLGMVTALFWCTIGMVFWDNTAHEFHGLMEHYMGTEMPVAKSVMQPVFGRQLQTRMSPRTSARHTDRFEFGDLQEDVEPVRTVDSAWAEPTSQGSAAEVQVTYGGNIFGWLLYYGSFFFFAFVYQQGITKGRPAWQNREGARRSEMDDFRTAPFGCFENCDYCLYGFFCGLCRYADTVSAVGLYRYWPFFSVFMLQGFLFTRVYEFFNWQIQDAISRAVYEGDAVADPEDIDQALDQVFHHFNKQMQIIYASAVALMPLIIAYNVLLTCFFIINRMKMRRAIGLNPSCMLCDCLMWWFCGCCAIIQEAREIDSETGTRVTCCCHVHVDSTTTAPLVGAAVDVRTLQLQAPAAVNAPQVVYPAGADPSAPGAPSTHVLVPAPQYQVVQAGQPVAQHVAPAVVVQGPPQQTGQPVYTMAAQAVYIQQPEVVPAQGVAQQPDVAATGPPANQ